MNFKSFIVHFLILTICLLSGNYGLYASSISPDSIEYNPAFPMVIDCDPNFVNPNLEGGGFPNGWTNCFGTVDVQPGAWGVTSAAPEGDVFFGFHSNDFDFAERPQGELTSTLVPGTTYYLKFKFAIIPTPGVFPLWGGGGYGDQPGYIDVYASTNHCGTDEMIGTTPVIVSADGWVEYELIFTASFAHNLISFNPKSNNDKWVYIGLDDLKIVAEPSIINPTICEGESFSFQGNTWTEEGEYYHLFENPLTCDSLTKINLSIASNFSSSQNVTICNGETWNEGADSYSVAGIFNYTHVASNGCDSIITTNVSVNPTPTEIKNISICEGQEHFEGSSTYTMAGSYSDIYTSTLNCDSTVETNLNVNPTHDLVFDVQICQGSSYMFNGTDYTESDTLNAFYTTTLGCDSNITVQLTVSEEINTINEEDLCEGQTYTEGSSVYTSSGTYQDNYVTSNGCDSTVTSVLAFHDSFNFDQNIEICEGQTYQIGNNIYHQTGLYTDILVSFQGCDSIVETNLNVVPNDLFLDNNAELCEGETYNIDLSFINSDQILWSDNMVGPLNSLNEPGTYYVDILLDSCYVSDTIQITRHYVPDFTLKEFTACWGKEVSLQIDAFNGDIEWFNGSSSPAYIAQTEGVYTASQTNACGTYDYSADVTFEDCNCSVFIPNSFTPDGDGYNDTFGIRYSCDFIKFQFIIFDRWGNVAFSATNPDIQWTGELETKGYVHNSNVYNYVLNYTAINSEGLLIHDSLRGHITQIR